MISQADLKFKKPARTTVIFLQPLIFVLINMRTPTSDRLHTRDNVDLRTMRANLRLASPLYDDNPAFTAQTAAIDLSPGCPNSTAEDPMVTPFAAWMAICRTHTAIFDIPSLCVISAMCASRRHLCRSLNLANCITLVQCTCFASKSLLLSHPISLN
jgi:hypothetical protein